MPLAVLGVLQLIAWWPRIRRTHPITSMATRLAEATILLHLVEWAFAIYNADALEVNQLEAVLQVFKSLWWLVPGVWISAFLPFLVLKPIERSTGYPLHSVAVTFVNLAIILLAGFCFMAFVFEQQLTSA